MDKHRVTAGFIDFIIGTIIQFILGMIFIFMPIFMTQNASIEFSNLLSKEIIITLASMSYMVFRDLFGISLGKFIYKLRVIDNVTNGKPNFLKLILRNITWFMWPVEAILLLTGKKRIGDLITNTTTVKSQSNSLSS